MKKLIEGALHFQRDVFPKQRALYQKLASTQSPRWLFIACSDSRVMPSVLMQTGPGELFICRNAGNIVPAHGDSSGGVSATIEYAVQVLKVKHIIVCGHSDCGAMKAVLHPEKVATLPAVAKWVAYADRARAVVLENPSGGSERQQLDLLTRENVLAQLDNLRTLPSVAAKLKAKTLAIHGWLYDIARGEFRVWDPEQEAWQDLRATTPTKATKRSGRR